MSWQVQEAKQRFSELVRRTLEEGPQVVTRHGEEVVVVVAADEYRRSQPPERDFARRVIAVDLAVAERWGRTHAAGGSPTIDGLMAASAMVHGFVFVTRNVARVERAGVRVLNPWEPPNARAGG